MKAWRRRVIVDMLSLAVLIGQTYPYQQQVDTAQQVASQLSQIAMPLIMIVVVVLVPILVVRAVVKGILEKI